MKRPDPGKSPRAEHPGEAGFTLLEAAIVTIIFSAIVVSIYETVSTGQRSATEFSARAEFEDRAREAVRRLEREFYRARIVEVEAPPAAPAVVYQLPVDPDDDGDFTDASEQIEWGSPEAGNDQKGGEIRLEWRFDRLVSEADDGVDLNGDGDAADSFQIGRLVRASAAGQEIPIGPAAVATTAPDPGGDLTGDGAPDPPFAFDDTVLTIDLFFLNDDAKRGGPDLVRKTMRVTPRNPVP